jgi:hypothetical protein
MAAPDHRVMAPAGIQAPQINLPEIPGNRIRAILQSEARIAGLPYDIAEAVVQVESAYHWRVIGDMGEIGLMQVRPGTAAMLGFNGNVTELADPQTNIHYGVTYLAQAWRLAHGDLCRALMKYRAGLGEDRMTARSMTYCLRARSHLAAVGSPFAAGSLAAPAAMPIAKASGAIKARHSLKLMSPASVYRRFRQGTPAATQAFWKAQETRVRALNRIVEAKWRRRHFVSR